MDSNFYKAWFSGFSQALDKMSANTRTDLLKHCAKCCADTGILKSYQQHYQNAKGNRDEFYARLGELGGIYAKVIIPNKEYLIIFPECACDLHVTGGVNSQNLCECSRQSIIYIGEKIWGRNKITVKNEGTVLSGKKECKFRILFHCD